MLGNVFLRDAEQNGPCGFYDVPWTLDWPDNQVALHSMAKGPTARDGKTKTVLTPCDQPGHMHSRVKGSTLYSQGWKRQICIRHNEVKIIKKM